MADPRTSSSSSDPPERGPRYCGRTRASHGDPPPVSSSNPYSSQSSCDPSGSNSYDYDNDFSSMSTVPINNNGSVVLPPSVLRNGGDKMGGINSNGGGGGGGSRSSIRHHLELRNKRLASTRRISISEHSETSSFSDRVIDYIQPGNTNARSRFMIKISALVGLVGILGVVTQYPNVLGNNSMTTMGRGTRVLKDLEDAAAVPTEAASSSTTISVSTSKTPEHADAETAIAVSTTNFHDDFDQRRRRAADLPDGTVFTEPAHTRMCRTIIERLDSYDAGVTNFAPAIFTESEYVCRDPDAPYTSVMNMFAAQLLDEASDEFGLNVEYTHRCAKWERYCTGNMTTVQFHLPDPLSVNSYAMQPGCIDAPMLRMICSGCLAGADPTDPNCVLFPNGYLDEANGNTCDLGCYFSQVLPWIRNNLRTMATNWLNTVESRALTFWLRNAAEFSHREKDDMEVSVVSLSCQNDGCDMSQASCVCDFDPLPNWVYAMHVPRSSTNVAIVVTPTCAKFGEGCLLHAQELYHFFRQLYPRADVTENVITSTSSLYMRMITADHLVCPPGVGCLLPAIARDAYTYVYETTAPTTTVSTWLTCTPQDYINRMTIPEFPPAFVEGDCRHLRARVGEWANDMALAPSLQYSTPVDGYLGCADTNFSPTAEDPYRAPTTHRWDETIWATCPVEVMTKVELCTQMNRLGLKRILFVGDHTALTQAVSLASILGQNDAISTDPNVVPNFTKNIGCDGSPNFELTYVRNDRLEETGTTPSPGNPNCGPTNEQYCYPWSNDFQNFSLGQQLLIVNTGYHWAEDWEGYIANFQNFVGKIDELAVANAARANDVIMFRTSIPGHKECNLYNGYFHHYGEYCPKIVNGAFWHWWGELPPYNDYAIRIINEWNLLNTVKSGPDIELLDPWMMTVLRPDGHLSGSDAGSNCVVDPQECMLYSLPGPVDWWNHLLIGQLQDIGTHKENSNQMQAWRR